MKTGWYFSSQTGKAVYINQRTSTGKLKKMAGFGSHRLRPRALLNSFTPKGAV